MSLALSPTHTWPYPISLSVYLLNDISVLDAVHLGAEGGQVHALTSQQDGRLKSQQVNYFTDDKYATSRFSSPSEDFVHIEISYKTDDKDYKIVELSAFAYLEDSCENKINTILKSLVKI